MVQKAVVLVQIETLEFFKLNFVKNPNFEQIKSFVLKLDPHPTQKCICRLVDFDVVTGLANNEQSIHALDADSPGAVV